MKHLFFTVLLTVGALATGHAQTFDFSCEPEIEPSISSFTIDGGTDIKVSITESAVLSLITDPAELEEGYSTGYQVSINGGNFITPLDNMIIGDIYYAPVQGVGWNIRIKAILFEGTDEIDSSTVTATFIADIDIKKHGLMSGLGGFTYVPLQVLTSGFDATETFRLQVSTDGETFTDDDGSSYVFDESKVLFRVPEVKTYFRFRSYNDPDNVSEVLSYTP